MRPSTASRPGAVHIDHVGLWVVVGSFTLRIHGNATFRDAEMRLTLRSLREPVLFFFRLDCTGSDGGRVGSRERACVVSCHDVLCSAHLEPSACMLHNIIVRVARVAIGSISILARSLVHRSRIHLFVYFAVQGHRSFPSPKSSRDSGDLDFLHIFLCALL